MITENSLKKGGIKKINHRTKDPKWYENHAKSLGELYEKGERYFEFDTFKSNDNTIFAFHPPDDINNWHADINFKGKEINNKLSSKDFQSFEINNGSDKPLGISTLRDFVNFARDKEDVVYFIEPKNGGVSIIIDYLMQNNIDSQCWLLSFDKYLLKRALRYSKLRWEKEIKTNFIAVNPFCLLGKVEFFDFTGITLGFDKDNYTINQWNVWRKKVLQEKIIRLKESGVEVMAGWINSQEDKRWCEEMGINHCFTDKPEIF